MNVKNITTIKNFAKLLGQTFPVKNNRLITDEKSTANIFNDYFFSIIKHLHMERNEYDPKHAKPSNNPVLSVANKFQNHPSILNIKSNRTYSGFTFRPVNYEEVLTELKNLDMSKITQVERIPTKIVKENLNIFATFLVKDINTCIRKGEFPDKMKAADITLAFKKGDKHDKSNYRPVSILPICQKFMKNVLLNK